MSRHQLALEFVAESDDGKEVNTNMLAGAVIAVIDSRAAAQLVVAKHYLHRRPPISHAFGLYVHGRLMGVVTYGTPASRHLQMGACPSDPSKVIELNRLWLDDVVSPPPAPSLVEEERA